MAPICTGPLALQYIRKPFRGQCAACKQALEFDAGIVFCRHGSPVCGGCAEELDPGLFAAYRRLPGASRAGEAVAYNPLSDHYEQELAARRLVRYQEEHFLLDADGAIYEIPAVRVTSAAELLGWIEHLCGTYWFTPEHAAELIWRAEHHVPAVRVNRRA